MTNNCEIEIDEIDVHEELINAFCASHWFSPCPFCGSSNIYLHWKRHNRSPYKRYYFFKCDICRAYSGAYSSHDAAYAHWQARTTEK